MADTPTMRSQFEAWFCANDKPRDREHLLRRSGDSYTFSQAHQEWTVWQTAWQAAFLSSAKEPREETKQEIEGRMAIRIEKLLLAKLGREWTPDGISIASLIDELATRCPAKEPQTEGWRDIASAPKDGTKIDLCGRFGDEPVRRFTNAFWSDEYAGWQIGEFNATQYAPEPIMTGWMPLPALPSSGGCYE